MTEERDTNAGRAGDPAQQTQPQSGLQGLVFVNDYQPGVGFQMVSRVQQPTVNQIIGYIDPANPNQGDGAVVDPADWNGYIVNYQGCGPGNYNLVFLREGTLQQGQTYSFTTNAVFFSNQLQLLESQIQQGAGGGASGQQATTEQETQAGAQGEQTATAQETTATETETETPTTETTTTETTTTATETATETEEAQTTAEVVVNATESGDG